MQVDLKVAQLLCSRLCHDLVGPAGAVNAGVELLGEGGGAEDALDLLGKSAKQGTTRLAFFRAAFGAGGAPASGVGAHDLRGLVADLLDGGGVALDWPPEAGFPPGKLLPPLGAKLLLNVILMGIESLPRGGVLGVRFADLGEGIGAALTAEGVGARLRADLKAGLAAKTADDLDARNVHAFLASCLASEMDTEVELSEENPDQVRMAVMLPSA